MFLSRTETDAFFDDCAPDERGLVHQHHIDELFRTFCDDRSPGAGRDKKVDDGRWYLPENKRYVPEPVVQTSYDRVAFANMVDAWHIPSSKGDPNKLDEKSKQYESALPMGRRLRAHWSMEGPQSTFIMLVVALQTALGVWLLVKQLKDHEKLDLLGWGLVVAKTSAGVLYPTLALLILSSSRSLGTWLRKSPILSKFVNWDLSQEFHIQMAITAFVFTTLHVIGHLGGTFVHLARSQPGRAAVVLNNFKSIDPSYADVIRSLPGITGLLAVAILVAIGLCSHPRIRRKHFELFQATHLLVYPLIGLLMAHGTRGWLQAPMLGYWLALPTLILLGERLVRVFHYVVPVHATIVPQQSDVVMLILKRARPWKIQPGQYILLCVPSISLLQWHPFTVSSFSDCEIRVHIRTTSGRWTSKIKTTDFSKVMVDGPFGSPAEKFYGYDRTVVIGTGIGITPYIGVLSHKSLGDHRARRKSVVAGTSRAIDLHWIAREASVFSWFATLLNSVSSVDSGIRVNTYLTSKPVSMASYVFSVLVDRNQTPTVQTKDERLELSALTGLRNTTVFGRPDFADILARNEAAVPQDFSGTIGVFFCGPKYVGMELSDRCKEMSMRKKGVQWEFIGEVF